ncbi:Mhf1p Ecym_5333 [Eremothecium cymbalariae DBVPG|uniref:Centromere protein S n=1 Tax=Eremothecium cymbalariae (strain CBS 270.75 / DBVPG 7215 / KCTC 17166 / NRRL Y-17582) TaxID=931890 RepID=I6NDF0_ERECY|nr:hypothetical protein Ecym_5333 [Eremothecium cymbalariae DBVPG\
MSDNQERNKKLVGQLKGKLWFCIEQHVKRELPLGVTFTPKFINALVELCFAQLTDLGADLEAFARHAGRETIVSDDFMLRLRKNPDLQQFLREELATTKTAQPARSSARK